MKVNLTKGVQDLYGGNSKIPHENMKKTHALFCDRKDSNNFNSLKNIQKDFFKRMNSKLFKTDCKVYMKKKKSKNSHNVNEGDLSQRNIRTYYL